MRVRPWQPPTARLKSRDRLSRLQPDFSDNSLLADSAGSLLPWADQDRVGKVYRLEKSPMISLTRRKFLTGIGLD